MRVPSLLLLVTAAAPALSAQQITVSPRAGGAYAFSTAGEDGSRAILGISTGSSGKRDTLGLLVQSVTAGSPAEKAGLEEGNRIASVNGVNLKLAKGDAGEPDMNGVMSNRLVREMKKVKAGDEVTLEVWAAGRTKSVKVKTVAADDLEPVTRRRQSADERAAIGVNLSSTGSKRDTLGVFVSGVTEGGPAEKAGIAEGDRIAAVNGVDLRVTKDDIEDGFSGRGITRLEKEIAKLKPGQTADLTVLSGGRSRSVKVTAGKASELHAESVQIFNGNGGMMFSRPMGAMELPLPPVPPPAGMAPMAPTPPNAPRVRIYRDGEELPTAQLRQQLERARVEVQRSMERLRTTEPRVRIAVPATTRRIVTRVVI
jgi:predicted metalloprotease with PDZ domain